MSGPGWVLGVLGGSGLYEIEALQGATWRNVESPWGAPSDMILHGELHGIEVRFLPRHGRGHRMSPTHINYRANIDALKRSGASFLRRLPTADSDTRSVAPGDFVVVDQFIDRTYAREKSFFGEGVVAHVSLAEPVCPRLSKLVGEAAEEAGARVREGGTYLCMEGPQFSTRAESDLYRDWGCHVIGMTNMPEAKLAREAELPYASLAMVTDYDCWHDDHGHVQVADIVRVMHANADKAKATVAELCKLMAKHPRKPSPLDTVLDAALITPPAHRDPVLAAKLDAVAGRAFAAARAS
jgi:5'-methylthioadenosine phosphorylase